MNDETAAAVETAWIQLEEALARRAPRLLADLMAPASAGDLAAFTPALPPALAALYRRHDGQRGEHRHGVFPGAYFLPLRGPESVENELGRAPAGILAFTKDHGGSWHGLVTGAAARFLVGSVVFRDVEARRPKRVAPDLASFLAKTAADIASGKRPLDDRREERVAVTFPFAGERPRPIDDPALRTAGISLAVVDTSRAGWLPSPFRNDPFPPPAQAIFVRCEEPAKIVEVSLLHDHEEIHEACGSGPLVIDGQTHTGFHYAALSGVLPASGQARVAVRVVVSTLV